MAFSDDDVKFMDEFGAFIHKNARFRLSVDAAIALNRLLSKYNVLRNKVHDHIFEIGKVTTPPEGKKK